MSELVHYLKIRLDKQLILMRLEEVQIVVQLPALQIIPSDDPALMGLLNFHSVVLPVFSLKLLLTPDQKERLTLDTPVIICQIAQGKFGLICSDVLDVAAIKSHEIQSSIRAKMPSYVGGVWQKKLEGYWVLKLEKLIEDRQLYYPEVSRHDE